MKETKVRYGQCRYCGESRIVEGADPDVEQDDIDMMATEECSCAKAKEKRNEADQMQQAEWYIEELTKQLLQEDRPEDAENLKAAMKAGANAAWRQSADRIVVKVRGKSVEIKRSADKIRFKTSWSCKYEVEF